MFFLTEPQNVSALARRGFLIGGESAQGSETQSRWSKQILPHCWRETMNKRNWKVATEQASSYVEQQADTTKGVQISLRGICRRSQEGRRGGHCWISVPLPQRAHRFARTSPSSGSKITNRKSEEIPSESACLTLGHISHPQIASVHILFHTLP